jgi:hypothetical protein
MSCPTLCALTLAVVLGTSAAYAQQTDGGAATTVPSQPPQALAATTADDATQDNDAGFVDKAKNWAERTQIIERLSGDIDGWYPRLGGMTRGGGFAIGPGYRTHLGDVFLDLSAGISVKSYKSADVKVRWLQAFGERVEFWTNYRFEDFPQEDFFGIGPDSSVDARTSYDFDSSDFSVLGIVKPMRWVSLGTRLGYMSPEIGPGADRNFPSIESLFSDVEAFGLIEQPNFVHTTFFADIDYRDERGRPRSGGFYHAAFGIWDDRTLQRYDHRRFDVNASQWVPLDAAKAHVVLGRIGASYANNETGERVPFYFLPYVGGVDTVRSFREFRFKDENALWMTAEYNWTPMKYFSLAAFVDGGKVSADWEDINAADMKTGYGFGFRVHTNRQTFARLDFGTGGGEGWQMFLKLVPSF